MKRAPSLATPSIYSHTTTRSTGLKSTRSIKSLNIPWYRTPWLQSIFGSAIQKYSLASGVYSVVLSIFTIAMSLFDLYCLAEVTPGTTHYGDRMSFDFVYVGNPIVRNMLIIIAVVSALGAIPLFVTSVILIQALRKENEKKIIPWLICMVAFATFRLVAFIFTAIVNDMIFPYNIMMCVLWTGFTVLNFVGLAIVYSFFLELADLTKLEDLANLRMGTMTSLATQSVAGYSRPTTPHSTLSVGPSPTPMPSHVPQSSYV